MTKRKNPTRLVSSRLDLGSAGVRRSGRSTVPRPAPSAVAAPGSRPRGARTNLTQAERTALSDARMLHAAVQLIDERGTHNTTLKDVGELAGYSRGLASSRFGSKEALFFELLGQFNRRWKEESETSVGRARGIEAFRASSKGLIAFFRNEATFIRVMYMVAYEMVGSSELMRQRLSGQHEAYRRGVARWIREGVEEGNARAGTSPERVALQYVAGVFGIIYQWLVSPESVDCPAALDDLLENALALIGAST